LVFPKFAFMAGSNGLKSIRGQGGERRAETRLGALVLPSFRQGDGHMKEEIPEFKAAAYQRNRQKTEHSNGSDGGEVAFNRGGDHDVKLAIEPDPFML
jgi:hypothetical protein